MDLAIPPLQFPTFETHYSDPRYQAREIPEWPLEVIDDDILLKQVYKLMSGETMFFKSLPPQELFIRKETSQKFREERVHVDLTVAGGVLVCAGEIDSSLYFYTVNSSILWTTYKFYKTVEQRGRYELSLCRMFRSRDDIRFAVQQPYFVRRHPDNKDRLKIEAFDEHITPFSLDTEESAQMRTNSKSEFVVHRNRVFVYNHPMGTGTHFRAKPVGRVVLIDVALRFNDWNSVFANDSIDYIFVLGFTAMFIIQPDLTAEYFDNKPGLRISGFHEGVLYLDDYFKLLKTCEKYEPSSLHNDLLIPAPVSDLSQIPLMSGTDLLPIDSGNSSRPRDEYISTFKVEYIILGLLGSYGAVFRVKNKTDGCEYTVKRVAKDVRKGTEVYALREVRALTKLNHPNIIRYCHAWDEEPPSGWQMESDMELQYNLGSSRMPDGGSASSFLYLKMELCGASLQDWLESHQSSRDLAAMKTWFARIISAVAYIHDKGIMHRDLKPGNILIDFEENLKICDFGLVTDFVEGQSVQCRTRKMETILYMPLEQLENIYDWTVDVFSLGLIYAEMCVPMRQNQLMEIFDNFRKGAGMNYLQELPDDTSTLIASLTSVDPKMRPRCKDILKMLE